MDTAAEQIKEPIGRTMGNISRAFLAELHQNLEHLDIDRSFYPLLLIDAGKGNITQNELAAKLSCDKVQVVRIIDYLSINGYVERAKNIGDRRKCSLEITEKARKVLPDIKMAIQKTSVIALKNIPENKINELYGLLTIIDHNLSSHKVD
jgi:MarR family transcriptional regulator, transcriptional regulator for hemolysin